MISAFQLQLILQVQRTSTSLLQWCGESEIGAQSLTHSPFEGMQVSLVGQALLHIAVLREDPAGLLHTSSSQCLIK